MKIVKSKLSIAFLSLGFVSAIGAVSYATIYRSVNREPDKIASRDLDKAVLKAKFAKLEATLKEADSKNPVAPHQDVVQDYLDQMKGYMQTPPRDGVFGSDRIPTLHGKESEFIKPYEAIRDLEGKVRLRSTVLGLEPVQSGKSSADIALVNGVKPQNGPADHIRLNDVHFVSADNIYDAAELWDKETDALKEFAVEIRKKGLESDVQKVTIDGKPNWIVAKAVHASVNSCYKCHANVKKGEAIGYVAALISDPKS